MHWHSVSVLIIIIIIILFAQRIIWRAVFFLPSRCASELSQCVLLSNQSTEGTGGIRMRRYSVVRCNILPVCTRNPDNRLLDLRDFSATKSYSPKTIQDYHTPIKHIQILNITTKYYYDQFYQFN